MSKRRTVPLAALVAAALFAVAFGTSLLPWLTRERPFVSSTPTTLSRIELTDVPLRHEAVLCVHGVGLDPTAEGLQFKPNPAASAGSGPPLRIEIEGPGYRSVTNLPGGYPFDTPVVAPVRPPARDVSGARICVRNEGKAIVLVGTEQPIELARVRVRLNGKKIIPQPWLTFVQRRRASVLTRRSEVLDRVAAFRPFPAVPLLLGMLAVVVLVGVPLAVVGALALAERADRDGA